MVDPERSLESYFADWESYVFGFGYGSGEEHVLAALKTFFETVGEGEPGDRLHCYDYQKLETALTPTVAWLLINVLCEVNILEYGTSPRYAWLTEHGIKLKKFFALKSLNELIYICISYDCGDHPGCSPSCCNCGPNGYDKDRVCPNPFFPQSSR